MPVRRSVNHPLADRGATSKTRHVRFRPGFIDEDQASAVEVALMFTPVCSPRRHIRTILLLRVDRLFLNEIFRRLSAMQIDD